MESLPGWGAEDHAAAFAAVRDACVQEPRGRRPHICDRVLAAGRLGETEARRFLDAHFRAEAASGEGLLTAYYAPLYEARRAPDGEFTAPVRPPPPDPTFAPDRAEIDRQPATGALAWMRPEDLYFLQVQGSGVLAFPDGDRERAVFAASNGRPYVAIARPMEARGLVAPGEASSLGLHAWLAAHRGPEAEAVMCENPRYIFFRLLADDGAEPRGASGARLTAGRSVAVDPRYNPYFQLLWIDAERPTLRGAQADYRRLVVALDTGSAIRGPVRADLYLGGGEAAGAEAGRVRHSLRLWRIEPAG